MVCPGLSQIQAMMFPFRMAASWSQKLPKSGSKQDSRTHVILFNRRIKIAGFTGLTKMMGQKPLRRDFLKSASAGLAATAGACISGPGAHAAIASAAKPEHFADFDVRTHGATGDGLTVDTPAINQAIAAAHSSGGGTVRFPAGTYLCYSIRLKSNVALHLEPGATILAAEVPVEGRTSGAYDPAEPNEPWDKYQDFGHSHWHNSLIWGEGLRNVAIFGTGLIWGKGLSRGGREKPLAETPGMGNKAITLKNCQNVVLRDFSVLEAGHFAILATGVDNLTIDNLLIDTNRDGIDVDCCRNVRISNCSVNSPWDDAICPKSSYALGYARSTENVTIANCYVTGAYQMGTMLDGSWKRWTALDTVGRRNVRPYYPKGFNGSIKLGTESNGGFKNIAISNCVFDGSKGFALESSDGAIVEAVTFSGITMRDCTNTPLFLRLGGRMRGPSGLPVGRMRGITMCDIVSYNSESRLGGGGIFCGIQGHRIEDVKIHDVYLEHTGGGTDKMASLNPAEEANDTPWPDPIQFGDIPASGFFLRHIKNIEFTNVEIAFTQSDARTVFWIDDVDGVDLFRIKTPRASQAPMFLLQNVQDFSVARSRNVPDQQISQAERKTL
jgi:polygalacturonase